MCNVYNEKGIISKSDGMQLPNDEFIKNVEEGEKYKYWRKLTDLRTWK